MNNTIKIYGQLEAATTDGVLADAAQVKDSKLGKMQEDINEDAVLKSGLAQELGDSEEKAMSQKAVKYFLSEFGSDKVGFCTILKDNSYPIVKDGVLTLPSYFDIYTSDKKFYRFTENQSLELPTGHSAMYLDWETKSIVFSNNASGLNLYLIGSCWNGNMVSLNGLNSKISVDGDIYYDVIEISSEKGDSSILAASQKALKVFTNPITSFIPRVSVAISGNSVTLSKGLYIFFYADNSFVTYTLQEDTVFTLDANTSLIYSNRVGFHVDSYKDTNIDNTTQFVLCTKDAVNNNIQGPLADYVYNTSISSITKSLTDIAKNRTAFVHCIYSSPITVADGVLTLPVGTDFYMSDKSFYRLKEKVEVELYSGHGELCFNKSTHRVVSVTSIESDHENWYIFGHNQGSSVVYLNGAASTITVDGVKVYNQISETTIKNLIGSKNDIPSWVDEQGLVAYKRFYDYLKDRDGDVVVFPIITDTHSVGVSSTRSALIEHCKYMGYLDRYFAYDFQANLGDIGLDVTATATQEDTDNTLMAWQKVQNFYKGVTLFTPGNHDRNSTNANAVVSDLQLKSILQNPSARYMHENLHLVEGKNYGYYDLPMKKTRILFLDTSESPYYMGQYADQLQFIIDALNEVSGYTFIVMQHVCPHKMSLWASLDDWSELNNYNLAIQIYKDCIARKAGSVKTVKGETLSYNFTSNTNSIVGLFAGHSHFDNEIKEDGLNFIVRQGYGNINDSDAPDGARHLNIEDTNVLALDVVAIDLKSREFKIFKVGLDGGDGSRDTEFSY